MLSRNSAHIWTPELFQSCISRDKVSIFFYVPILRVCVYRLLSFGITMLITALLKI